MTGLYAAIWLLGLLAAASALRTGQRYDVADRLRDALVLGVAIPFLLGILGLLYPATCWLALAVVIAIAYRRAALAPGGQKAAEAQPVPYVLIVALALVAWPQLVRPLLDGDSLSYHLPNAAAWVHAHGIWTSDPRYWWYPPGSELFASALFAVSGPLTLGWSGFAALALVGFRIVTWARADFAAPPWLADGLAAAVVTAAPLALQAGSLQNDVWLSAFFLEALWTSRNEPSASARTFAVTVLVKPYGWIFALTAGLAGKARRSAWFAAAAVLALWVAHDALLWNGAAVSPASTSSANTWGSTILAHGLPAIALLGRVCLHASPFALLALIAAFAGPLLVASRQRPIALAAFAAAAFFIAMPLAYADEHPQLATGASLRFAAPAIALGALLLLPLARRAPRVAAALLTLSAAYGTAVVLTIFWNDAPTRSALAVALVAAGAVALARATRSPWPVIAGLTIALVVSRWLAARDPAAFYADALRVSGKTSAVYGWIAKVRPPVVGGWGLLGGTVNVLSPDSRAFDVPDDGACAAAADRRAILIALAENGRSAEFNANRLKRARACGRVRYDDGIAVVAGF